MIRPRTSGAFFVVALCCISNLRAHRTEGLQQSTLVELLPNQVGVQVTLLVGIDIASKFIRLLDTNGDSTVSVNEKNTWSIDFLAQQAVIVDDKNVPLALGKIEMASLAESNHGHFQISVHYTAGHGTMPLGRHRITCSNHYQPIPCVYQTHGIVPKDPGISGIQHRRDSTEQTLTLEAEYNGIQPQNHVPASQPRLAGRLRTKPLTITTTTIGVLAVALVLWWKRRH